MRTRHLIARSLETQDEILEELRLSREDRVQHREEWSQHRREMSAAWAQHRDEIRHQMRLTREAIENDRDVTRAMVAELRDHGDRMRDHDERMRDHDERMRIGFEVTFGALADLAAEIRTWRSEGGSGPAA